MIGCGCDEKALSHKETSAREVEKCICLDKEPWDYSVLLETTDKTFAVQYTVKYVHQWNSNFYRKIPDIIYEIRYRDNVGGIYYSLEEPEVNSSGLMKFTNALTGRGEAINFTGVRWTIKPLTHKHNPDGLKAIEYEKIYSKVRKKCPAGIHKESEPDEEDI